MNLHRSRAIAFVAISIGLLGVASARAASLQKVGSGEWAAGVSGLPSYINMYIYVPDQRETHPAIMVASHHCQGSGTGTYGEMASMVTAANKSGFIMIFPEATDRNCWDVGSSKSLTHDGKGDTHAIAQMVRYTLAKYSGDPGRVYAVGGSSGAMMTQALLGVYPDLFMAGAAFAGVPCGCWAEGYTDGGANPQWSGSCAGGKVNKTSQAWGDLVRATYPGYSGHRPRVQIWHGTADTTINYNNFLESIEEWTNVLGLSTSPTSTETPKNNYTHQSWQNDCGYAVLESWSIKDGTHGIPFDSNAVLSFFGLDKAGAKDPEMAMCGAGSAAGTGGTVGAGGATSGGGSAHFGGRAPVAGAPGGGDQLRGGTANGTGRSVNGGTGSAGTALSTGGQSRINGSAASGSTGVSGRSYAGAGAIVESESLGMPSRGGSGAKDASSAASAGNGLSGSGAGSASDSDSGGCSCRAAAKGALSSWGALALGALALLRRRRPRRVLRLNG